MRSRAAPGLAAALRPESRPGTRVASTVRGMRRRRRLLVCVLIACLLGAGLLGGLAMQDGDESAADLQRDATEGLVVTVTIHQFLHDRKNLGKVVLEA